MAGDVATLFLSGDLMLGRGVDQILPRPAAPELREPVVLDARDYVQLAYAANGSFPVPVDASWPWGAALEVLEAAKTSARVVNLETSITSDGQFAPGKEIHYRMSPGNIGALTVARPSVCVLANNHVLDFGVVGLTDTLTSLAAAGIPVVGAGFDRAQAWRPVIVPAGDGRLVVGAAATGTSGVPSRWAATLDRPGVARLPDLTPALAATMAQPLCRHKREGDVVVASLHWGSNWGYEIEPDQVSFARCLIDEGVDVVHGHSSHHPRPIEVYRGKLILYGCGDLINDYEGIGGHTEFRSQIRLLYLVTIARETGRLVRARLVPMRARQISLWRAGIDDAEWLSHALGTRSTGCRIRLEAGGDLIVEPASGAG